MLHDYYMSKYAYVGKGALIGAGVGAGIGAYQSKNKKRGALRGAAGGAILGGLSGALYRKKKKEADVLKDPYLGMGKENFEKMRDQWRKMNK